MDLEFTVENQNLTRTDTNKPVNLSDNYLNLIFTFNSTDWVGLTKFVIFNEETRVAVINDTVTVPSSVLTSDRFYFTVYGVDSADETTIRITTNYVRVYLIESKYTSDTLDDDEEITTDVIEDIYIAITQADNGVIESLNNRVVIDSSDEVIQDEDTTSLRAYYLRDGMPKVNKTIIFYKEE